MDGGGLPHAIFLKAIELLGARAPPRIRREIGRHTI
jgi:hypothetical protein